MPIMDLARFTFKLLAVFRYGQHSPHDQSRWQFQRYNEPLDVTAHPSTTVSKNQSLKQDKQLVIAAHGKAVRLSVVLMFN